MRKELSYEYIRGLVEGEGSFTFSSNAHYKAPSFQIRMHMRDRYLLESISDFLGIKNKIYTYHYKGKDGAKRGPQSILIVREFGALKNIIIPLFYNKLFGNKAIQFNEWLDKIGSEPLVSNQFKLLHRLHKSGFYAKNEKYL